MKVPADASYVVKVGARIYFSALAPEISFGHLVVFRRGERIYLPVQGKRFTVRPLMDEEPGANAMGSVAAPRSIDDVMTAIRQASPVVDPDFERAREVQKHNRIRNAAIEGVW